MHVTITVSVPLRVIALYVLCRITRRKKRR